MRPRQLCPALQALPSTPLPSALVLALLPRGQVSAPCAEPRSPSHVLSVDLLTCLAALLLSLLCVLLVLHSNPKLPPVVPWPFVTLSRSEVLWIPAGAAPLSLTLLRALLFLGLALPWCPRHAAPEERALGGPFTIACSNWIDSWPGLDLQIPRTFASMLKAWPPGVAGSPPSLVHVCGHRVTWQALGGERLCPHSQKTHPILLPTLPVLPKRLPVPLGCPRIT